VTFAYEVLSDPEKRKLYDQYGREGIENEGGAGHNAEDIFSMFFGGGRRGPSGPRKGEDLVHPLKVTLDDLYNGKTCRLAINRSRLCGECDGKGGKAGTEKTCATCQGHGVQVQYRQIGPGMVQKLQGRCDECKGEGKGFSARDRCRECSGKKIVKERKVLEVNITRGMKHNQKISFHGEADETPGVLPGDVVFVIQEKEHDQFKRKGADLLMEHKITLTESLCGFDFVVRHMDGRDLRLTSLPGHVTKHDHLMVIDGEGMPHHTNPYVKGRLFVLFKVVFPTSMSAQDVAALQKILPERPVPALSGEEEEVHLEEIDPTQFGQNDASGGRDAYDSDDERAGGGQQRVQCQNM
jgi:DnaJ family protein A protein 2